MELVSNEGLVMELVSNEGLIDGTMTSSCYILYTL